MDDFDFEKMDWFGFLDEHGRRLALLTKELYKRELRLQSRYQSYSFVVFPLAKAYEGFLKYYLREIGILSTQSYIDKKFRIGRALNPDVSLRHRDEWWLYDDLVRLCSKDTARLLWDTWLECRNRLFHFYFDDEIPLSLEHAKKKIIKLSRAMEEAMRCAREHNTP